MQYISKEQKFLSDWILQRNRNVDINKQNLNQQQQQKKTQLKTTKNLQLSKDAVLCPPDKSS